MTNHSLFVFSNLTLGDKTNNSFDEADLRHESKINDLQTTCLSELKSENEKLRAENDSLKQQLSDLENEVSSRSNGSHDQVKKLKAKIDNLTIELDTCKKEHKDFYNNSFQNFKNVTEEMKHLESPGAEGDSSGGSLIVQSKILKNLEERAVS